MICWIKKKMVHLIQFHIRANQYHQKCYKWDTGNKPPPLLLHRKLIFRGLFLVKIEFLFTYLAKSLYDLVASLQAGCGDLEL